MFFYGKSNWRHSSLILCTLFTLSACGGGGSGGGGTDGGGSSGGIKNISYQELPFSLNADENSSVQLTLNTSGAGANNLAYDWEVTFNGEALPFQGQNTDTITFTAPEVDGPDSVSVSYELDLKDGTLLGPTSGSTRVYIVDLNAPEPEKAHQLGKTTDLPVVDALDLATELTGGTWVLTAYSSMETLIEEQAVMYELSSQTIAYLDSKTSYAQCGLEYSEAFEDFDLSADCATDLSIKYYQAEDEFRQEASCGPDVVLAQNFKKLNDARVESFGQLSLSFDSYSAQDNAPISCGEVINVGASGTLIEPTSNTPTDYLYEFGMLYLYSEYQSLPTILHFSLDDFPQRSFYSFSSVIAANEVTLYSSQLPALSGIEEGESGTLIFSELEQNSLEAEFRVDKTDSNGAEEEITGTFSLSFE